MIGAAKGIIDIHIIPAETKKNLTIQEANKFNKALSLCTLWPNFEVGILICIFNNVLCVVHKNMRMCVWGCKVG